jgi:hypothetical protein
MTLRRSLGQPEGENTMRARYRRSAGNAGRGVKLACLWGAIITTLGGFTTAIIAMTLRPPDPYVLCQRSAVEATATTVVMIDPTDKFDDTHLRRLRTTIETERDRLPKGGRLTLLVLNPHSPWEPVELVSVCNPGAHANIWFETRAQVEKRWAKTYAEPIEAAIARIGNGAPAANSPIFTTIAAALNRPDFDARVTRRFLVLISDLLEHEQGVYSQLKGDLNRPWPARARIDLKDVAVRIDYLMRGQYAGIQGEKHREFWARLLMQAGASEVTFVGLKTPEPPETGAGDGFVKRAGRQ